MTKTRTGCPLRLRSSNSSCVCMTRSKLRRRSSTEAGVVPPVQPNTEPEITMCRISESLSRSRCIRTERPRSSTEPGPRQLRWRTCNDADGSRSLSHSQSSRCQWGSARWRSPCRRKRRSSHEQAKLCRQTPQASPSREAADAAQPRRRPHRRRSSCATPGVSNAGSAAGSGRRAGKTRHQRIDEAFESKLQPVRRLEAIAHYICGRDQLQFRCGTIYAGRKLRGNLYPAWYAACDQWDVP